ncbi:MAG: hypothetical protein SRB2_02895 [Desulfobacteraceae bacterium Eth-SRB2]|nr:MAG: hypothetical protein SRB2_02895 [Desulfobacteraceae bacterium Eth-SRB2]
MLPELKKAIMKFVPDYFSWDKKRQEQYRVDTPEEDAFKIMQYLLRELFDISVYNDDEVEDAWRAMNEVQCSKINATLLPIKGIGEDFFYLNEAFPSQKNLLSFETLYDYDFDDYKFQEDSRKKEQKDYEKKPYRGSLYLTWARLMIDDSFSYGLLSMVAGYLYCQLDEYGNDYMEKLIPHEFIHGKNHGKAQGDGYLFDLKIEAKGLESQLDELKHRFWKHLSEMYERLMDEFDKKSKQRVFILNQSQVGNPNHHFLFTDKEILKRIHFKTFMRCCCAAEQTDHSLLSRKLEEEKQLLTKYLDNQYKDIMENFDPKIVRFRKKYKVIFHRDSGFHELLD